MVKLCPISTASTLRPASDSSTTSPRLSSLSSSTTSQKIGGIIDLIHTRKYNVTRVLPGIVPFVPPSARFVLRERFDLYLERADYDSWDPTMGDEWLKAIRTDAATIWANSMFIWMISLAF
jgi:hypothetical protein